MSTVAPINKKALTNGMVMASTLINDHLTKELLKVCEKLLKDVATERDFQGFTGQTQTSFMCGLYLNGALSYTIEQKDFKKAPIRTKIRKGERVRLEKPYEGVARTVRGQVDVNDKSGRETSIDFLSKYKNAPKKGFAIVVTTGTEYSEYLEAVRGLNVLSATYAQAKNILLSNLKPMKK